MFLKTLVGVAVIGSIFFSATVEAYDLPKFKPAKKPATPSPIGVSDWTSAELFEQKMKMLLVKNKTLPASSPERINNDKNLVFVAFYKDKAYFLDRYSIKVTKNKNDKQSWRQNIFAVGREVTPQTAARVLQKFSLQDNEFYNSLSRRNKISEVEDNDDKNFLAECFRVGYYYAFKKELHFDKFFD